MSFPAPAIEYRVVVVDADGRLTSTTTLSDRETAVDLFEATLVKAPEGLEWTVRLQTRTPEPNDWEDITPYGGRDPERIRRIAGKFARAWSFYPDMRAGQLMVNITGRSDPFYVPDDKFEAALDEFLADPPYDTVELAGAPAYIPHGRKPGGQP